MLQNILGALGMALNGLVVILFATEYGFAGVPSTLVFLVGAVGMLFFHQVSPVLVQTEMIVLAGSFGKDRNERLSICVYAGILTAILGAAGVTGRIVDFVGGQILYGVMAGVGILLTRVSFDLIREKPLPGALSAVIAAAVYFLTGNFIYTLASSILISAVVWDIAHRKEIKKTPLPDLKNERFALTKLSFEPKMLRGSFALTTLLLGGIISECSINASMAGTTAINFDAITLYSGIATILSPLFGGVPGGMVVSGTASAPDPILSGLFLTVFLWMLLLFQLAPRMKRYLPMQCVAGLLFVLGAVIIFPENAAAALDGNAMIGVITMLVSAFFDPFSGLCAGILVRFLFTLL